MDKAKIEQLKQEAQEKLKTLQTEHNAMMTQVNERATQNQQNANRLEGVISVYDKFLDELAAAEPPA